MALKKNIKITGSANISIGGISIIEPTFEKDLGECYIKVDRLSGNKGEVVAFVTKTSADGTLLENGYGFIPDMEGPNFIKQAYDHLKTLPEFEGAVDC